MPSSFADAIIAGTEVAVVGTEVAIIGTEVAVVIDDGIFIVFAPVIVLIAIAVVAGMVVAFLLTPSFFADAIMFFSCCHFLLMLSSFC